VRVLVLVFGDASGEVTRVGVYLLRKNVSETQLRWMLEMIEVLTMLRLTCKVLGRKLFILNATTQPRLRTDFRVSGAGVERHRGKHACLVHGLYVKCINEEEAEFDSLVILNLANIFAPIELDIGSVLLVINISII